MPESQTAIIRLQNDSIKLVNRVFTGDQKSEVVIWLKRVWSAVFEQRRAIIGMQTSIDPDNQVVFVNGNVFDRDYVNKLYSNIFNKYKKCISDLNVYMTGTVSIDECWSNLSNEMQKIAGLLSINVL
ncbi:unnamed protein product [Ambrosiozyma monospora]|uniref:Unnamed protein product n=1 Tax=Ambrosiozyma monospora TaxID=43982 RepID=A0A9W6WEB0_AMBMO|nr:unnamed protein product [Ambrosiozyma monospora]